MIDFSLILRKGYGISFILSFIGVLLVIPLAKKVAFKLDMIDYPKKDRFSRDPIPYLGGVALVAAFFVAIFISYGPMWEFLVILAMSVILSLMGLIDDYRRKMDPWFKFGVQIFAAIAVYLGGVEVKMFPYEFLNLVVTVFWIVGITNAFNLLDNMDGLSAGIAGIAAMFFFIVSAMQSHFLVATLSICLAGVCFAFLRYNFNPATIFMGDAGSYFLGFFLAILGIKIRFEDAPVIITFLIPIMILAIPIIDTTLVVFDRLRHGKSIWQGGTDHMSHRLRVITGSTKISVGLLYLLAIGLGCNSLVMMMANYQQAIAMIISFIFYILSFFILLLIIPSYDHEKHQHSHHPHQAAK